MPNQILKPLKGFLTLKYKIEVLTGLHIGGSKDSIEIGGIDNPVIKLKTFKLSNDTLSDVPYIPGSSLKGKIRSLLELAKNKPVDRFKKYQEEHKEDFKWDKAIEYAGKPCDCGECEICKLFGTGGNNIKEPIRLRFSEFYPTKDTIEMWKTYLGEVYTEMKTENVINRITSTAQHPRHTERVIANSVFEGDITFRVFEDDGKELIETLEKGIKLLEKDYLGGSGSRGYGRVKVHFCDYEWYSTKNEDIPQEIKQVLDNWKENTAICTKEE